MSNVRNGLQFKLEVGVIDADDLKDLGFEAWAADGRLNPKFAPKLITFCEKNPQYHIATLLDGALQVNCHLPNGWCYYLCEGSKNPEIISLPKCNWESFVRLRLYQFEHDES